MCHKIKNGEPPTPNLAVIHYDCIGGSHTNGYLLHLDFHSWKNIKVNIKAA